MYKIHVQVSIILVFHVICSSTVKTNSKQISDFHSTSHTSKLPVHNQHRNGYPRGVFFNVGIPVPDDVEVKVPDASYTLTHTIDYWPYKKFYTISLSSVFKALYKSFWYLSEFAFLGIRIALQVFDIFQMRKSYETLSKIYGPGWSGVEDRRLGTVPNAML